jgi:SAM-dependent methyltransferase
MVSLEVYRALRDHARTAPPGELSQFSNLLRADQYRVPYRILLANVARGSTVLDWGCGDGHFSFFLLQAGHRVVSFSLQHSPYVLRHLPDELASRSTYVQGNPDEPTRLPFDTETFDAVTSVGVLEHVRETGGTEIGSLCEIRRVLKSHGAFLCFHLPNRFSYIEAASRWLGRGHHAFRYSKTQVLDLFGRAGFEVTAHGTYAFLPRNLLSRLPGRIGNSTSVAQLLDTVDDATAAVAPWICQNRYVVAAHG